MRDIIPPNRCGLTTTPAHLVHKAYKRSYSENG
jgi:hypothetical protein